MKLTFSRCSFLKIEDMVLVSAILAACAPAFAATPIFDFETSAEVASLPYRARGKTGLDIVQAFATSGTNSLRFTSPAWRQELPEWPSFELKTSVHDWRGYDRLVVDIVNPSEEYFSFALFVSDSRVPIRKGLHHTFALASFGYARCVVPLSEFPDTVNRADIATLHFFATRPQTDMVLHLDAITLLKKGEELPDPPPRFVKEMAALSRNALDAADRKLAALGQTIEPYCETPEIRKNARRHLARFGTVFQTMRSELDVETLTLDKLADLQTELVGMSNRDARLSAMLRFQQAYVQAGNALSPMLVGTATSMEQLLPRDTPFALRPARTVELRLARNEKESFQLAVLPADTALEKVSVRVSDLTSPAPTPRACPTVRR